jgi:hypothetical protein
MDMVVHCGKSTVGSYLHSLVLTDIASGWTEAIAMVVREQTLVTESVSEVRRKLPFSLGLLLGAARTASPCHARRSIDLADNEQNALIFQSVSNPETLTMRARCRLA